MLLTLSNNGFDLRCRFEDREVPRKAGFRWSDERRVYYTKNPFVAIRFGKYADQAAADWFRQHFILKRPSPDINDSPSKTGDTLRSYQKDMVRFSLERNRSYQWADMGTGKGVVAPCVVRSSGLPAVYVCPPFLVENTKAEFERWAPESKVLIVPDSQIHKYPLGVEKSFGKYFLIIDEAHRFNNEDSRRSRALFGDNKKPGDPLKEFYGLYPHASRVMFMSGTAMTNRPRELYNVLNKAAPSCIRFMSFFDYGRKYCAGHIDYMGHWNFDGASNVDELRSRLYGSFMLRTRKSDVLSELPEISEELFFISHDFPPEVAELETKILREHAETDLMGPEIQDPHVATYRRLLGEYKVDPANEFIRGILEANPDERIFVVGVHRDALSNLRDALSEFEPPLLNGDMAPEDRHRAVTEFQAGRGRVILGNIEAAGVGITLTSATMVLFFEYSWVPGINNQARDRVHRFGLDHKVRCIYLSYRNSIDARVLSMVLQKQKTLGKF